VEVDVVDDEVVLVLVVVTTATGVSWPRGRNPLPSNVCPGAENVVPTDPDAAHASDVMMSIPRWPASRARRLSARFALGVEMKKSSAPVRGLVKIGGMPEAAGSKRSPFGVERFTVKFTSTATPGGKPGSGWMFNRNPDGAETTAPDPAGSWAPNWKR